MKALLIIALSFLSSLAAAQQIEPIAADRPDQTETPSIVPKGYIQIETGFSYEQERKGVGTLTIPSILSKYGVTDRFEIRLITEVIYYHFSAYKISGLIPIEVGLKTKLIEESGIVPTISFLGHLSIPHLASHGLRESVAQPRFRFSFEHTLSDNVSLAYNLGAEWHGTSVGEFIFTLSSGISLSDKVGTFFELFGSGGNQSFDTGLSYLLSDDIMLDMSGGIGLTDRADAQYFFGVGASFRFKP